MRIGYKASAEQFSPEVLASFAVHAEQKGFDSVMVSDHFQPWRLEGGHSPSALAFLSWVAARTDRVTLGTSVLTPTFRYNPAVMAQYFATLACLAPGRVILGVGSGEALNEVAVGAVDANVWPAFKERFGRMREAVTLMKQLWTEANVSFDGEFFQTRGAAIYDRPATPVPIYVAAGGPLVARYAGRHADGFICTSGKGPELYTDKLLPAVGEGLATRGGISNGFEKMIEIKVSYDRDPHAALENTRFWAPLSLTAEEKHSLDSPRAMEKAADALPIEKVASRWIVSAEHAQVVSLIGGYVEMGFDHLVIHGPGHDQIRFMDQFAEDIMPGLRKLDG